jgi:hypothetical protein
MDHTRREVGAAAGRETSDDRDLVIRILGTRAISQDRGECRDGKKCHYEPGLSNGA